MRGTKGRRHAGNLPRGKYTFFYYCFFPYRRKGLTCYRISLLLVLRFDTLSDINQTRQSST